MKRFLTVALLSAAFTSLPSVEATAAMLDPVASFDNTLTGSQEVPPTSSPAIGTAKSTLSGTANDWVFSYMLEYSGLTGPLQAGHIHEAPFGANGPVVHELENLPAGTTSGMFSGDWSSGEAASSGLDIGETFKELLAGNYYFNLHTVAIPSGEIRGQIQQTGASVPEPASTSGLLAFGALGTVYGLKNRKNTQKSASGATNFSL